MQSGVVQFEMAILIIDNYINSTIVKYYSDMVIATF